MDGTPSSGLTYVGLELGSSLSLDKMLYLLHHFLKPIFFVYFPETESSHEAEPCLEL